MRVCMCVRVHACVCIHLLSAPHVDLCLYACLQYWVCVCVCVITVCVPACNIVCVWVQKLLLEVEDPDAVRLKAIRIAHRKGVTVTPPKINGDGLEVHCLCHQPDHGDYIECSGVCVYAMCVCRCVYVHVCGRVCVCHVCM